MTRSVLSVVLAAAGLAACTYVDREPSVALVPATPTVVERQMVVPAPLTTTTVIERQQGVRVY